MSNVRRSCVQVRKVLRDSGPIVKRTTRFVERHIVRTSVVVFVPSVLNDTVIHHVQVSPIELLHVVTDDVSVTSLTALATLLMRLL